MSEEGAFVFIRSIMNNLNVRAGDCVVEGSRKIVIFERQTSFERGSFPIFQSWKCKTHCFFCGEERRMNEKSDSRTMKFAEWTNRQIVGSSIREIEIWGAKSNSVEVQNFWSCFAGFGKLPEIQETFWSLSNPWACLKLLLFITIIIIINFISQQLTQTSPKPQQKRLSNPSHLHYEHSPA
jgi:hypothetical protein